MALVSLRGVRCTGSLDVKKRSDNYFWVVVGSWKYPSCGGGGNVEDVTLLNPVVKWGPPLRQSCLRASEARGSEAPPDRRPGLKRPEDIM